MKHLLTTEQLADRLGVTTRTIYKWIQTDRIPHIKLGRVHRFDPESIQQWLDHRRREPEC